MKTIRHKGMMLAALVILPLFTQAQIVGTNAYLQDSYVELGINDHGTYMASETAPAGYHDFAGFSGFGLVADSDKDGWAVGSPGYCGDYFEPGSPEEGFAVKVSDVSYYNTPILENVAGSIIGYSTPASGPTVVWKGVQATAGININQVSTIPAGGSVVLTTVKIKNTTASTLTNVYYSRNADPDNDNEASGSFVTNNLIVQNHPADEWAMVSATGTSFGCYLALASKQSNSRASYGGFATSGMDPQVAYSGSSPYSASGTTTADVAMQMTFKINSIAPGAVKVLNFVYGTNQDDMEDMVMFTTDEVARKMELAENGVAGYSPDFSISPNPSNGIINLLGYGFDEEASLQLDIFDMTGRLVMTQQLDNASGRALAAINLPGNLMNGTYLASFKVNGESVTQPFILNR